MTTKHRFHGKYRLVLREDDHLPAHVHLVGGGIDAAIDLETFEVTGEIPGRLSREVLEFVKSNRDTLMKEWKKWHP